MSTDKLQATQEMVDSLRHRVRRDATRWRRLLLMEALGLAVAAPLAYLWLLFLLDNLLHLHAAIRTLASLVFLAAVVWLARSVVRRWRALHITEDQVALAIEQRTPGGLENRIINSIQITRETKPVTDDDRAFHEALVLENHDRLKQIHLEHAAHARPAIIRIGLALLVIAIGVVFGVTRSAHFANAAARMLMPFADIDPLYETKLVIEPGNIIGSGDITIRVRIEGKHPGALTILRQTGDRRDSDNIPLDSAVKTLAYTFKGIDRSLTYAVRGGDFTSPYFRIDVPTPSVLNLVKLTLHYPEYTGLQPRQTETAGGDLEALLGCRAETTFVFDQPIDEATLIIQRPASVAKARQAAGAGNGHGNGNGDHAAGTPLAASADAGAAPGLRHDDSVDRIPLKALSSTQMTGQIVFEDVLGYQIQTKSGKNPAMLSPPYGLRVIADQPPSLELSGLDRQTEVMPDASVPAKIFVSDDYGIDKAGLFYRPMSNGMPTSSAAANTSSAAPAPAPGAGAGAGATTQPSSTASATTQPSDADEGWRPLATWPGERTLELKKDAPISVAAMGASEGEKYELSLRAMDTDPRRAGRWTTGPVYTFLIGGEGVALQMLYEQIIRGEEQIKAVIAGQQRGIDSANEWLNKLDPSSGLRWDDKTNLDTLSAAMKQQAAAQEQIRQMAATTARDIPSQAGNLRLSFGLLADTEMVRSIRILEAVTGKDNPQAMRSTLGDARLTQERTIRSLQELQGQYTQFRHDWELSNMIPLSKVLADRQARMRDESGRNAAPEAKIADAARVSSARRQTRLGELTEVSRLAMAGLSQRLGPIDATMSTAFAAAATSMAAPEVKNTMAQAATYAGAGQWKEASAQQDTAAKALMAVHVALLKAQAQAALAALAALKEKAKSDVEAQKELERLKPGNTDNMLAIPDDLELEDVVHMRQVADGKKNSAGAGGEGGPPDQRSYDEVMKDQLQQPDRGMKQTLEGVTLAQTPGGWMSAPNLSDRPTNAVKPMIQEQFDDLVGKLLDEADQYAEKYDTLNINMAMQLSEAGDVSKQGGMLNSTAAAAFTGNQKPPPTDSGGISRTGRQGARAHGMVLGDESINRRGRDEVQEGQERVPDQAGSIKEKKSEDPQPDVSTGLGGKKVEAEDVTWNTSDKGKFDPETIDKMGKPEAKTKIVERMDQKIDAKTAALMRDMDAKHEQVIERIKAIKKELNTLYLPTEHLDELMAQLNANFDALRDRPNAEAFRAQKQTIDKLRSAARVFSQASSRFQPSLPREQQVRGPVVDDPARQTIPGYEDAVKAYYEMLASP